MFAVRQNSNNRIYMTGRWIDELLEGKEKLQHYQTLF